MPGRTYSQIYEIAEEQHGYFTTQQARHSGVRVPSIIMMEKRGLVDHVSHGLYSLVLFPSSPLAPYMEAVLWPYGARGVISHESALFLWGLLDHEPTSISIMLPRGYRVRRTPPPLIQLRGALPPETQVEEIGRLPVLSAPQALKQVLSTAQGIDTPLREKAKARGLLEK